MKLITGKTPKITYEIVADLPELKKLIGEFGKIGSNLNQIARYYNSGGIHSQEMRKYIQQGIADIFEMKHEVLKMAGDLHFLSAELSSIQKGCAHGHPLKHITSKNADYGEAQRYLMFQYDEAAMKPVA